MLGTLAMVQAVVRHMAAQGSGKIINVRATCSSNLYYGTWHVAYGVPTTGIQSFQPALQISSNLA